MEDDTGLRRPEVGERLLIIHLGALLIHHRGQAEPRQGEGLRDVELRRTVRPDGAVDDR